MKLNWRWILIGVIIAAGAAVGSLLMMIHLLPRELMKGAGIDGLYVTSVERVKASGVVAKELGTPVDIGAVAGVHVSANLIDTHKDPTVPGEGVASFDYPVSGPKLKGTVHVYATETKSVWTIQKIVVQLPENDLTVEDQNVPEA